MEKENKLFNTIRRETEIKMIYNLCAIKICFVNKIISFIILLSFHHIGYFRLNIAFKTSGPI